MARSGAETKYEKQLGNVFAGNKRSDNGKRNVWWAAISKKWKAISFQIVLHMFRPRPAPRWGPRGAQEEPRGSQEGPTDNPSEPRRAKRTRRGDQKNQIGVAKKSGTRTAARVVFTKSVENAFLKKRKNIGKRWLRRKHDFNQNQWFWNLPRRPRHRRFFCPQEAKQNH